MKKLLFLMILMVSCVLVERAQAQSIVAQDTLSFAATRVVPEPDPNSGEYVFTIWGSDTSGQEWKIQIDYLASAMCGTFTDADFDLTGSGKAYNWIRKADDDRYMRYFTHLDVTVSEQNGDVSVDINGLFQDQGTWRRLLTTAEIPAARPHDTVEVDLGRVSVIPNTFYGSLIMEAANAEYSLAFGIAGTTVLESHTYYRTELLRPDFVSLPNDTIKAIFAEMDVTDNEAGLQDLVLHLLSEDSTLYEIYMHTGALVASDTILVECAKGQLRDMTDTYGLYQLYGEGEVYNVAIAVKPAVLYNNIATIPVDSIYLDFTTVARRSDLSQIRVEYATAQMVLDTADATRQTVYADLLGADGVLYQVVMPFGGSGLPAAADTVVIECGDYVGRVDYTKEAGYVGFVLGNDDADVHISVYTGFDMNGLFTSEYFDYTIGESYVTTYPAPGEYGISDVQLAEMRLDSVGDTLNIALDVINMSNVMYRFTARLLPKRSLTGDSVSYSLNQSDGVNMVALRMENTASGTVYHMQLQRADAWDADGEPVGDSEIWDFMFPQGDYDGIQGVYGYNAGNLYTERHVLVEDGTEIYLGALAGTLIIEPGLSVRVTLGNVNYRTHYYNVTCRFVAPNGLLYSLSGMSILVCVDYESGDLVELTEDELTALEEILKEQEMRVKKVLRGGVIVIETDDATYTTSGQRVR